jgi:phosphoribosylglycinamide formyltransferase 1
MTQRCVSVLIRAIGDFFDERPMPIRLTILACGSGTTLQNLIDLIARGELDATIGLVVGSRDGLGVEARARSAGIRYEVVAKKDFASTDAFSQHIFALCDEVKTDLVCCAGWLALLSIPERYRHRVINVHPALLPSFGGKGMWGHHVHAAVLEHGCKISGCTVHFLDHSYDTGPIILQRVCEVRDDDTPATLAARVQAEERIAFPEAIRLIATGRVTVNDRRVTISGR